MTGVQTCALPICFPVTIGSTTFRFLRDDLQGKNPLGPGGAFASAFSNAFANSPNSTYTSDTGNYPGTSYGADILPEVGDIIMWNESYWEVDNVNDNQLFVDQTKVNIYGEAAGSKYYNGPVLLNVLVERGDNQSPTDDFGVSFDRPMTFRFLRDDLQGKNPLGPGGAFASAGGFAGQGSVS